MLRRDSNRLLGMRLAGPCAVLTPRRFERSPFREWGTTDTTSLSRNSTPGEEQPEHPGLVIRQDLK